MSFGNLKPISFKKKKKTSKSYLNNNGLAGEAIVKLAEFISAKQSEIRAIHAFNNLLQDAGAKAFATILSECGFIEEVRLGSARINEEGCLAICESLKNVTSLVLFDLSDNSIGLKATEVMSKFLPNQKDLKFLHLNDGSLGKGGVDKILKAITNLTELEVLNLAANDINSKQVDSLVTCLSNKSKLQKLILSDNELESEGVKKLAKGVKLPLLPKLEEIDLCTNQIGGNGILEFLNSLFHSRSSSPLRLVSLNSNSFNKKVLSGIDECLKNNNINTNVLGPLDENEDEEDED